MASVPIPPVLADCGRRLLKQMRSPAQTPLPCRPERIRGTRTKQRECQRRGRLRYYLGHHNQWSRLTTTIIQGGATQAAASEREMDFVPGAIATATINDVTIRNGNQVATGGFGGGIRNNGAAGSILNLTRCVVTNCKSVDRGGGVSLAVAGVASQLNVTDSPSAAIQLQSSGVASTSEAER